MTSNFVDIEKLRQCFDQQRHSAQLRTIPAISCQLSEVLPEGKREIAQGLYADIDNQWISIPKLSKGSFAWILLDDIERWLKQRA